MATRQLTQQEIDAVFQNTQGRAADRGGTKRAVAFDFRRPDRIAKSQLHAIHQLHDNFVRNLVSSLSAYLRSYLIINLVSVEQLSYSEFLECLPSPTCLASLGLKPYDGNAVLELNSSLIFPILEILLGGDGKLQFSAKREITEIEQVLLDGLLRLILRDLREAWTLVTPIDFTIENIETEPQFLQILAPSEAVVAVAIEIRIGDSIGMMNIAMPSIIIKMMRQKFDQQWTLRKSASTDEEQARVLNLLRTARLDSEVLLAGPQLLLRDLMNLEEGDVLSFEYPTATSARSHPQRSAQVSRGNRECGAPRSLPDYGADTGARRMTTSPVVRTIHSPWLGEIESDPESELYFPGGLPGFEDHHGMVAIEIPSQRPVVYLQSLESDEVCFAALPVYVIDPSFRLHLSEDERAVLQLAEDCDPAIGNDVLCLALLRKSERTVEANTGAAIVINLHNRRGVQCVPPAGASARFGLCPDNGWRRAC